MSDVAPLLVIAVVPTVEVLASPLARLRPLTWTSVAVLLAWSCAAHGEGALLRSTWCWNAVPTAVDEAPRRVWDVRDGQLTAGWRALRDGSSWAAETRAGAATTEPCDRPTLADASPAEAP